MKRIEPSNIYHNKPCSIVALGCAMHTTDKEKIRDIFDDARKGVYGSKLHDDGYLSLSGMNSLIRCNMKVIRRTDFKRGSRPSLRELCYGFSGKAIVCLLGHFVYVEDGDYYSFFANDNDQVVAMWEVA